MSRLTGADAYGLMEAYNNVYAPQELTEEQVWEEVENWVNSLLEEGYDLSDYTWEEMYDAYANLNEGRTTSLSALSRESQKSKDDKKRGRPETKSEIDFRLAMSNFRPGASQEERAEGGRQVLKDRGKVPKKGGKDMFEHILEHLVAEGYADTNESALVIMANMSEEWRQSIVDDFLPKSTTVIPGKYGKNTVLSKKDGVEGVSDKSKPGSFTPQKGGFDKMDAERYATQHSKQGTSSGTSGINLAGRRETSGRVK